jgi:hypothetical protein
VNSNFSHSAVITIKRLYAPSLRTSASQLLDVFWTDALDSDCVLCQKSFNHIDPPIRTVSLDSQSPFTIEIHNRHLSCINHHPVQYIPISHVWHSHIAISNLTTKSTPGASQCLFDILTRIFFHATIKFKQCYPKVEFWHDYVSIPQWQRPVQQALLLILPEIYKMASVTLIHLEDITSSQLTTSIEGFAPADKKYKEEKRREEYYEKHMIHCYGAEAPKKDDKAELRRLYEEVATFFHAKWFDRMWVSIEYAFCRQACVYTADDVIIWHRQRENFFDSFTWLFENFQRKLAECVAELGLAEFSHIFDNTPVPLLGPLTDMRKNVQKRQGELSFGEALAFIAGRASTCYRDRYLAMSGFLGLGDYSQSLQSLPREANKACLSLARMCLTKGDFSPLLMLRRNEVTELEARWLVGHQAMSSEMWDLGSLEHNPEETFVSFQPSASNMVAMRDLHLVGEVIEYSVINFPKDCTYISTFNVVIKLVLSHYNNDTSTANSVRKTLQRIYGLPEYLWPRFPCDQSYRYHFRPHEISMGFRQRPMEFRSYFYSEHSQRYNEDSITSLEELLRIWLNRDASQISAIAEDITHIIGYDDTSAIAWDIAHILGYDIWFQGPTRNLNTLLYAGNPLHQAETYNDCILTVKCPGCESFFLYRASVLKGVEESAQLYRVPGLGYKSSLQNGVGVLVLNNEIVGRMIYGIPACDCKILETVCIY